jgi:hypothetical protein
MPDHRGWRGVAIASAASPVRPALRDFIKSLAGPDGTLPIWSRWFGDARRASLVGLDILASDPVAFAEFESGLPRLSVERFDDTIELANWDPRWLHSDFRNL